MRNMKIVAIKPFYLDRKSYKKGDPVEDFKHWPRHIQFKYRGYVSEVTTDVVNEKIDTTPVVPVEVETEITEETIHEEE